MKDVEELVLLNIWKTTYHDTFQYKREIIDNVACGNRIKIKSSEITKNLGLSYHELKPILDTLKQKKLITGFIQNEQNRAGWTCTSKGSQFASYINNSVKASA